MKISKEFRWEMGHRLPFHDGICKNLHGHSYKMVVEITGEINENGMIIDFYDLAVAVKPIIDELDHAFLCWENDKIVRDFVEKHDMKRVIVSYHSTVENICSDLCNRIYNSLKEMKSNNFQELCVRIFESPNASAEMQIEFPQKRE
ncbi:MAG: 6-carboxytetrahydropterin synthase [Ignavibacteriae bacterium]|nr:MAG: 6-carboxytetrahydropterin synthase [Ignavibacteriota bacterium]